MFKFLGAHMHSRVRIYAPGSECAHPNTVGLVGHFCPATCFVHFLLRKSLCSLPLFTFPPENCFVHFLCSLSPQKITLFTFFRTTFFVHFFQMTVPLFTFAWQLPLFTFAQRIPLFTFCQRTSFSHFC